MAHWLHLSGLPASLGSSFCFIRPAFLPYLATLSLSLARLDTNIYQEATSEQQRIVLEDDEPAHLSTLLKYLYHFVYDDSARNSTFESPSTFNIKLYAIADKYNVLAVQMDAASKFAATCDPKTNETDFIQAIYTVDEYTSSYDAKLWEILMPKIKSNLLSLLAVKEFKDLLQEKPELNIRLLEVLGTSAAQDDPLVIELMIKASEQPTGWFEIRYSGGQGRRLG